MGDRITLLSGARSGDRQRRLARRHFGRRRLLRLCGATSIVLLAGHQLADALTITPTFDSTVTSNANSAAIEKAVNYVCKQYENLYSDPVNLGIQISVGTTGLAGSNTEIVGTLGYSDIVNALTQDATSDEDSIAVAHLPASDPTPPGSLFAFPTAEGKALNLIDSSFTTQDGQFTFNGNLSYTFDPANRAVAGKVDFIGLAEQEISEIMGRLPGLGVNSFGQPDYYPFDLFRYTAPGALKLSDAAGVYFSIDGGNTNLKNLNFANGNGSAPQDWANGTPDAYNAFAGNTDEMDPVTPVDVVANDILGYDLQSLTWTGSVNGTWDIFNTANWSNADGATTYTDSALLVFDDTGTHTAITLNQQAYTTSILFASDVNNYILSGTGGITGLGSLTKSGASILTINTSNSYTGPTTITEGTLTLSATGQLTGSTSITIDSGATMNATGILSANAAIAADGTINFGGTTGHTILVRPLASLSIGTGVTASITASSFPLECAVLKPTTLSFADSTAKLNVTNNELVSTGSAAAAKSLITSGQVFTTSTGGVLGYGDAGGGQYEIRFTFLGDANLDGMVNSSDFSILAANYGKTGQLWGQGDFNGDGTVNALDFNALATFYGHQLASADLPEDGAIPVEEFAANPVPEPTGAAMLLLAGARMLHRRKKR